MIQEDYVDPYTIIEMRKVGFKDNIITLNRALKWFEKEYNLAISVVWINGWLYSVRDMGKPYIVREVLHLNEVRFETRQAATDAAIRNAIELLLTEQRLISKMDADSETGEKYELFVDVSDSKDIQAMVMYKNGKIIKVKYGLDII